MEEQKIITFENVCKEYRIGDSSFFALKDASFAIKEGNFVVILGPSGAGKSTLLNLLSGMDTASSGKITFFDGQVISDYTDKELTRYRAEEVGIVFQFYNLIPSLTAYENVALMRDIKSPIGDPEEALKAVGLERQIHQFPSQLSGGEQQRTSIARAVVKNPRLLLCDEPTGALDTATGREVLKLLQNLCRERHTTVVMVTHNSLFADVADQVIYVKNGTVEKVTYNETVKSADEVEW
ncbi:MAG: ABC transporter ATP-binding protein [Lachnospiraceae bacterium]|nr:ABC transporter ATP-binding protein [Lachnospiraceae bacterium]